MAHRQCLSGVFPRLVAGPVVGRARAPFARAPVPTLLLSRSSSSNYPSSRSSDLLTSTLSKEPAAPAPRAPQPPPHPPPKPSSAAPLPLITRSPSAAAPSPPAAIASTPPPPPASPPPPPPPPPLSASRPWTDRAYTSSLPTMPQPQGPPPARASLGFVPPPPGSGHGPRPPYPGSSPSAAEYQARIGSHLWGDDDPLVGPGSSIGSSNSAHLADPASQPVEVALPAIALRPVTGRTVHVHNMDPVLALRMLGRLVSIEGLPRISRRQRFHERAGLKRKRLKSERWRARFKAGFTATVKRVQELTKQGW